MTGWRFRAPVDVVFDRLADIARYPQWWQGVRSTTRLKMGDDGGVGETWRQVWRSRLPYDLVFDTEVIRVARPNVIEVRATGELAGSGVWALTESGDITTVTYSWTVRTTRPWMNLLAPIARPIFKWNHDYAMANGGRGLALLLGAPQIQA